MPAVFLLTVDNRPTAKGFIMWWKRLAATATLIGTTMAWGAMAARASGPVFGPPVTVSTTVGDAHLATTVDAVGHIHGYANVLKTDRYHPLVYFRTTPSTSASRTSPYTGDLIDAAWDGSDVTYVLYNVGQRLELGAHRDSTATFSAPTELTAHYGGGAAVVASAGHWWVVWSEQDGNRMTLFQRHTLLGSGERTSVLGLVQAGSSDGNPSLAFSGGTATLVWERQFGSGRRTLLLGTSHGGRFAGSSFASTQDNDGPEVAASAGHTFVVWQRGDRVWEKDNAKGPWTVHEFTGHGAGASIAVSDGNVFVDWIDSTTLAVIVGERTGSAWSRTTVTGSGADDAAITAGAGRGSLVYATATQVKARFQ